MKRKKKRFLKIYKWYVILLFVLMIVGLFFVYKELKTLEDNQPESFIKRSLINLESTEIEQLFSSNSDIEDSSDLVENVKNYFKNGEYEIKREEPFIYSILINSKKILGVVLSSQNHVNVLGIMSYDILKLEKIEGNAEKELLGYEFILPSNYHLMINDKEVKETSNEKIEGFLDGYDHVDVPKINKYVLSNLTKIPNIKIENENGNVDFQLKNRNEI